MDKQLDKQLDKLDNFGKMVSISFSISVSHSSKHRSEIRGQSLWEHLVGCGARSHGFMDAFPLHLFLSTSLELLKPRTGRRSNTFTSHDNR